MRDLFKKNLGLKALSLLIAISLEIYFISPQNLVVETFSAAVELEGLPKDRVIVWPPAAEEGLLAACKVRGPGPLIQELKSAPRTFRISFPANPPAIFTTELKHEDLKLPSGVELMEIQPGKFEFRIEKIVEKSLSIKPNFSGEVAPGFRLDSYRIEPEKVLISGPESIVSALEQLDTDGIDLGPFSQNTVLDIPLKELGKDTLLRRKSVRVSLAIGPVLADRFFSSVRVSVKAPEGFAASVTPSRVKAIFSGEEAAVNAMKEADLEVVAIVPEPPKGPHRRIIKQIGLVAPKLPPGVKLLTTEPAQVEVTLIRRGKS